jgi:hypothetical protein
MESLLDQLPAYFVKSFGVKNPFLQEQGFCQLPMSMEAYLIPPRTDDSFTLQLNNSVSEETLSKDTPKDSNYKEIHDKIRLVLKETSGDHVTEYIVEDFVGLFPIWQIVGFTLSPSGASKDKLMTQYVCCVLALFGEILLVDEKAAIAPIKVANNKQEDMITDSSKIPGDFTKLGKWLMMSGGSWAFNKNDSDLYAQFWLKSMVLTDEMVTRILF